MRLSSRLWLFEESLRWAIAEFMILVILIVGLWFLIYLITGLTGFIARARDWGS